MFARVFTKHEKITVDIPDLFLLGERRNKQESSDVSVAGPGEAFMITGVPAAGT